MNRSRIDKSDKSDKILVKSRWLQCSFLFNNGRLFNWLSVDLIDLKARCLQGSFTSGCPSKIDITFCIDWSLMSLLLWHTSACKTAQHFLPCPHQEWHLMFNLDEQLQKHFLQHNIKSTSHNLFHFGLLQGQQASSTCASQPKLSPIFQDLYSTSNFGLDTTLLWQNWTQLYYIAEITPCGWLLRISNTQMFNGPWFFTPRMLQLSGKQFSKSGSSGISTSTLQTIYRRTTLNHSQWSAKSCSHDTRQDPILEDTVHCQPWPCYNLSKAYLKTQAMDHQQSQLHACAVKKAAKTHARLCTHDFRQ